MAFERPRGAQFYARTAIFASRARLRCCCRPRCIYARGEHNSAEFRGGGGLRMPPRRAHARPTDCVVGCSVHAVTLCVRVIENGFRRVGILRPSRCTAFLDDFYAKHGVFLVVVSDAGVGGLLAQSPFLNCSNFTHCVRGLAVFRSCLYSCYKTPERKKITYASSVVSFI